MEAKRMGAWRLSYDIYGYRHHERNDEYNQRLHATTQADHTQYGGLKDWKRVGEQVKQASRSQQNTRDGECNFITHETQMNRYIGEVSNQWTDSASCVSYQSQYILVCTCNHSNHSKHVLVVCLGFSTITRHMACKKLASTGAVKQVWEWSSLFCFFESPGGCLLAQLSLMIDGFGMGVFYIVTGRSSTTNLPCVQVTEQK